MILWAGRALLATMLPAPPAGVTHVCVVIGKFNQGWMTSPGLRPLSGRHCCQARPLSPRYFSGQPDFFVRWLKALRDWGKVDGMFSSPCSIVEARSRAKFKGRGNRPHLLAALIPVTLQESKKPCMKGGSLQPS